MKIVLFMFCYFLLCRTLGLEFLKNSEGFYSIYLLLSPLVAFTLIFMAGTKLMKDRNCGILIYVFVYTVLVLIANFIAGGLAHNCAAILYPTLGTAALFYLVSLDTRLFKKCISLLAGVTLIIAFVHCIDSFIKPNIEGQTYIFGLENHVGYTMMIGLMYNGLNCILNNRKIQFYIYIILDLLSSFFVFSVGSLLGLLLFCLLFFFKPLKRVVTRHSLFSYMLIYLVLSFVFFLLALPLLETGPVSSFIETYLGKTSTLSGRTNIWPQVILAISNSPIFGNGFTGDANNFMVVLPTGGIQWLSAHNQLLQTLYNSGIIGLFGLYLCLFKFSRILKSSTNAELMPFFIAISIGIMVSYMTEAVQYIFLLEIMTVGALCCHFKGMKKFVK